MKLILAAVACVAATQAGATSWSTPSGQTSSHRTLFTGFENKFVKNGGGTWFGNQFSWSEGRFPEYPDVPVISGSNPVKLTQSWFDGSTTSAKEILVEGDDLTIVDSDLLIGPKYCDDTQTQTAAWTDYDDTQCKDNVICTPWQHETSARTPTKDRTCAQNVCKCANGQASQGQQCLASSLNGEQTSCKSCDAGYTLSKGDMGFETGVAHWNQIANHPTDAHITGSAHKAWVEVKFAQTYKSPVVIAGIPSYTGPNEVVVSVKDVTSTGFKMHLHETQCQEDGNDWHLPESVAWLVAEEGTHHIGGQTIVAGLHRGGVSASRSQPTALHFAGAFSADRPAPAILTQIQDASTEQYFVNLRQQGATYQSVTVYAQGINTYQPRGDETVGFLAVQRGESDVNTQRKFSAGVTPETHGNDDRTIYFGKNFAGADYALFGAMHTAKVSQPGSLRYSEQRDGEASVVIQENHCDASSAKHTNEAISWFAIQRGVLVETANPDSVIYPTCVPCGADNKYSKAGNVGQCQTCSAGSFTAGGNGVATRTSCEACAAGFKCSGDSNPIGCGKGRYAPPASDTCTQCHKGTFNALPEQESCTQCPHGRFQDTKYDFECKGGQACPCTGTTNCQGAQSCSTCAAGYAPNKKADVKDLFQRGYYRQGEEGKHAVHETIKLSITDLAAPALHPAAIESGIETWSQQDHSTWVTINFSRTYANPVVIAGIPSYNGGDEVIVSVKDVTSHGFKMHLHETQCKDDDAHVAESVAWLVAEEGVHHIGGQTIVAGKQANVAADQWTTINFDHLAGFKAGDEPTILSQIQDASEDNYFVNLRHTNAGYGSFDVRSQGVTARGRDQQARGDETVGYLVVQAGKTTDPSGNKLTAGVTSEPGDKDHTWSTIELGQDFGNSNYGFFGTLHTSSGFDPVSLRYASKNNDRSNIFLDENTCKDSETTHVGERVSYFAVDQGVLTVDAGFYVGQYITATQLCEADAQGSCINLTPQQLARFNGVTGYIIEVAKDEIKIARAESASKCVPLNHPQGEGQCHEQRWCEAVPEWKGHAVPDIDWFNGEATGIPEEMKSIDAWCNYQCASGPNRWNYKFCPTADGSPRSNNMPWNKANGPTQGQICKCHEARKATSIHKVDGDKECNFAEQCSHVYCTLHFGENFHMCPSHQKFQTWLSHRNKAPATGTGVTVCENGKKKHSIRVHHHGEETTCKDGHYCYAKGDQCICIQSQASRPNEDRCWTDVNTPKSKKACARLCKEDPTQTEACAVNFEDKEAPIIDLCGGPVEVVTKPNWRLCKSTAKDDIDGDVTKRISYTLVRRDTTGSQNPVYLAEGVPFAQGENQFLCGSKDSKHTCLHGNMHFWFTESKFGPNRRNPCPRTDAIAWDSGVDPNLGKKELKCSKCEVYNWTPENQNTHLKPKAGACERRECSCGKQSGCASKPCSDYAGAVDNSKIVAPMYDFTDVLRNNEEYVVYLEVCDDAGNCAKKEKAIKIQYQS